MFRQSPSRNQRSKGFKIKHGLQIFLLIAICFWLLYQVKHSHDKKKAFDESSKKLLTEEDHVNTRLGRKDLPQRDEKTSGDDIQEKEEALEGDEEENKPEEEEEENTPDEEEEKEEDKEEDKEEENKPEEEETEGENEEEKESKHDEDKDEDEDKSKHEEEEEEIDEEETKSEDSEEEAGRGAGDDEIDEQEQEKTEEDVEKVEDFADEEDKGSDEETNVGKSEDKTDSSEELEHDRNTQEAREESYKRDDASSAVVRETHLDTIESEIGSVHLSEKEQSDNPENIHTTVVDNKNNTEEITSDQSNPEQIHTLDPELKKVNDTGIITSDQHDTDGRADAGANTLDNPSVTVETSDEKSNDLPKVSNNVTIKQNGTVETSEEKSNDLPKVSNSSTIEKDGTHVDSFSKRGQTIEMINVNQTGKSNVTSGAEQSDSSEALPFTIGNADDAKRKFSNTSNSADSIVHEEQTGISGGQDNNSLSSTTTPRNTNGTLAEDFKTTEADNNGESTTKNENEGVIQSVTDETNSETVSVEEKEAHADLETLRESETQGIKNEGAAAE